MNTAKITVLWGLDRPLFSPGWPVFWSSRGFKRVPMGDMGGPHARLKSTAGFTLVYGRFSGIHSKNWENGCVNGVSAVFLPHRPASRAALRPAVRPGDAAKTLPKADYEYSADTSLTARRRSNRALAKRLSAGTLDLGFYILEYGGRLAVLFNPKSNWGKRLF